MDNNNQQSFYERLNEIPIVEDYIHIVSSTYRNFEGRHENVAYFINGGLHGLGRLTNLLPVADYLLSKTGMPTLDEIGCRGLDKIQIYVPFVKKEVKEIPDESRKYMLSKISGIHDYESLPDTFVDATAVRIHSLAGILSSSKVGQPIVSALEEAIHYMEEFQDLYLHFEEEYRLRMPNCSSKNGVWNKFGCLKEKTKHRFAIFVHKKEKKANKLHSLSTLENIILFCNYCLSNYYQRTRILPMDSASTKARKYSSLILTSSVMTTSHGFLSLMPYFKFVLDASTTVSAFCVQAGTRIQQEIERLNVFINDTAKLLTTLIEALKKEWADDIPKRPKILKTEHPPMKMEQIHHEMKDNTFKKEDESLLETEQTHDQKEKSSDQDHVTGGHEDRSAPEDDSKPEDKEGKVSLPQEEELKRSAPQDIKYSPAAASTGTEFKDYPYEGTPPQTNEALNSFSSPGSSVPPDSPALSDTKEDSQTSNRSRRSKKWMPW